MRVFYLGTHRPHWLADSTVPLFISDTTLHGYPHPAPRELHLGTGFRWVQPALALRRLARRPHAAPVRRRVRRYTDEIGNLAWASPQDHMCEPAMLARTGRTVTAHIAATVANYLELKAIDPTCRSSPWSTGGRLPTTPAAWPYAKAWGGPAPRTPGRRRVDLPTPGLRRR